MLLEKSIFKMKGSFAAPHLNLSEVSEMVKLFPKVN